MSTQRGQQAETAAAAWLADTYQWHLIAQNWRSTEGEIDLIMVQKHRFTSKTLHFIEVKYRRGNNLEQSFASVAASKQRQLQRAAAAWLKQQAQNSGKYQKSAYQIDVVAVGGEPGSWLFDICKNITYDE